MRRSGNSALCSSAVAITALPEVRREVSFAGAQSAPNVNRVPTELTTICLGSR